MIELIRSKPEIGNREWLSRCQLVEVQRSPKFFERNRESGLSKNRADILFEVSLNGVEVNSIAGDEDGSKEWKTDDVIPVKVRKENVRFPLAATEGTAEETVAGTTYARPCIN